MDFKIYLNNNTVTVNILENKIMFNGGNYINKSFSYEVINHSDGKILSVGETMHAWTNKALKPVNAETTIPDVYSLLSQEICNSNKNN